MSGFYEVTATIRYGGGGRRVHGKAPVRAGCCVSHPAASRTLTGTSDAARSPSPLALRARYEGDRPTTLTKPQQARRSYTAVAQSGGVRRV